MVVATNKAWTSAGQQKLVKQLVATGKPVVVVAVRDPYDIAYFTDAPTYLATYSTTAISMESLARVLFGEVQPAGSCRSPSRWRVTPARRCTRSATA